ncbi:MaoC family dehydratase [Rhodovulum sp. DZ06]|uniref:MaoC family dehydratase n=1 Tax=Rhodovulum sp. DZ06 TaxID=3425126 RepID=UPI003D34DF38
MQREWWAEDFEPGMEFRSPGMTLTEGQIIDFAFQYDPQPFHTDAGAAAESIHGGLIASGFHTLGVLFRMWQSMAVMNPSSQGAPGIYDVKWLRPVRPGDTLHAVATVRENRRTSKRPNIHIITFDLEGYNQRGEKVASWWCPGMFLRDPAGD